MPRERKEFLAAFNKLWAKVFLHCQGAATIPVKNLKKVNRLLQTKLLIRFLLCPGSNRSIRLSTKVRRCSFLFSMRNELFICRFLKRANTQNRVFLPNVSCITWKDNKFLVKFYDNINPNGMRRKLSSFQRILLVQQLDSKFLKLVSMKVFMWHLIPNQGGL